MFLVDGIVNALFQFGAYVRTIAIADGVDQQVAQRSLFEQFAQYVEDFAL